MRTLSAQALTAPVAEHGEGPIWCKTDDRLRWVDMLRGDLLTWDPRSREGYRAHVSEVLAALRPRAGGGFVVALERGFGFLDRRDLMKLPEVWVDSTVRMNDGSCDSIGRFYCGSMAFDATPGRGALYRLDTDGTVSTIVPSVTISNGLAFSPDGNDAYYVDSATQVIHRVDLSSGDRGWETRSEFVRISSEHGTPDGICLDSAGGVWVALWGGGAVHRYSSDGTLTHRVELPVSQPTACTLGGERLTDLYITTSTLGIRPGTEPHAGALFVATVETPGLPTLEFLG